MAIIYHIARETAWNGPDPSAPYRGDSLASQGFIHCSTRDQVIRTANRYYRGQSGLVLLAIDEACLRSPLRYELGTHGENELFPHLYGPLNRDAVVGVYPLQLAEDGTITYPA